jgi:hypothetical protein
MNFRLNISKPGFRNSTVFAQNSPSMGILIEAPREKAFPVARGKRTICFPSGNVRDGTLESGTAPGATNL